MACSNETDVLVVAWQSVRTQQQRRAESDSSHSASAFTADDVGSRSASVSSASASHTLPWTNSDESSSQCWLVQPRSEAAFGWCHPCEPRKVIKAIALASRDLGDALQLLRGRHRGKLERLAVELRVDEIGDRQQLPLVDGGGCSGIAPDGCSGHGCACAEPPVVVCGAWGVDAVVDARRGGAVLRFASPLSFESYDDQLASSRATLLHDTSSEFAASLASLSVSVVLDDDRGGDDDDDDTSSDTRRRRRTGSRRALFFETAAAAAGPADRADTADHRFVRDTGRARRETLRVAATRCELTSRSASTSDSRAGATLDLTVGDALVHSLARGALLRVVLERDGQQAADSGAVAAELAHVSLARQRDGATEVWRFAGLQIAPLSLARAFSGARDSSWSERTSHHSGYVRSFGGK